MKAIYKCFALALPVCVLVTPAAGALMPAEPPQTSAAGLIPDRTRFAAGVSVIGFEPKEEFRQNIGNGVGVSGTVQYYLDREGWGNIRFDPSWLRYGNETERLGGRVELEVTTTHQIIGLSFGPELAVPRGPIRPYINTAFSGLLFLTTSSVRGTDRNDQAIAESTNHSDWTKAWVVGSGVRIPLGGRDSGFAADVGVRYHKGSEASYLREGSIQDNPDGTVTITPLISETPFMMYTFGIRYHF